MPRDDVAVFVHAFAGNPQTVRPLEDEVPFATRVDLPAEGAAPSKHWQLRERAGGQRYWHDMSCDGATTPTPQLVPPQITSPSAGSILGVTEAFNWSAGDATEFQIHIGSTDGGTDIVVVSTLGAATSYIASGLPDDGSAVYVTLLYRFGPTETWLAVSNQYQAFTAGGGAQAPMMVAPPSNSVLVSDSQAWMWNINDGTDFRLLVGTSVGASDIHDSGQLGAIGSRTVAGLPANSGPIYVRLEYQLNGGPTWQSVDYQYTASAAAAVALVDPLAGAVLQSTSQTFQWVVNNPQVTDIGVYLGSVAGGGQYAAFATVTPGATDVSVSGLPNDGSTIHLRIRYKFNGTGDWNLLEETFTAFTGTVVIPQITAPLPGSVLTGDAETFTWEANGMVDFRVAIGSTVNGNDIASTLPLGNVENYDATGLPVDGSTVYLRLEWRETAGGAWQFLNVQYTATGGVDLPVITSPAPNSVLTGTDVQFVWDPKNATSFQLWAGSSALSGAYDNSGDIGTLTFFDVTGLPDNGSTVHITLYYQEGGSGWQPLSFIYTAFTQPPPEFTAPAPGSTLGAETVIFNIAVNDPNATDVGVYIGTSVGGGQYGSNPAMGTDTSLSVSGLPNDGSVVRARIRYKRNGTGAFIVIDETFAA